ncbi:gap junction protein delta 6 [Trichomycterus rosablanca]|uniref:gap junction protein delta 6 n=1 Tax=Trichomycterus rosablanca TaxID=2290929 RepID=UPI002F35D733
MSEWTLLKRLLDAVHQHSTLIGRIWLTVMAIFRLLVVAVAAEDVYEDERTMFVCDTLQPGCTNVCYDAFAPISQPRFWVFHIVAVSTPSLLFILYTWHNLSKVPAPGKDVAGAADGCVRNCNSESCSITSHHHLGHSMDIILEKSMLGHAEPASPAGRSSGVLSKAYVLHVCSRALLELAFLSLQWLLFGFRVPFRFACAVPPCPQRVHCYVSRPTEKTVFLVFMFCVGVFCVLLNLLELNHLGWKKIRRSVRARGTPRSGGFYGTMGGDGRSGTNSAASLPTLDLLVESRSGWTCLGNECCSGVTGDDAGLENSWRNESDKVKKPRPPKARASKRSAEVWI